MVCVATLVTIDKREYRMVEFHLLKGVSYMAASVRVDVVDVRNGLRLFRACHFAGGAKQFSASNGEDRDREDRVGTALQGSRTPTLKQLQLN